MDLMYGRSCCSWLVIVISILILIYKSSVVVEVYMYLNIISKSDLIEIRGIFSYMMWQVV